MNLYERQARTLVASWGLYATASAGAHVVEEEGATVCTFPAEPERAVYNNALLRRGLDAAEAGAALDAVERRYRAASIDRYAVWAHDSQPVPIAELERRGYRLDTSTRAMAMSLGDLRVPRPELDLAEASFAEHLRLIGVPEGLLSGLDARAFHVLVARWERRPAATGIAFDHEGDCGVFNLGTVPRARRRGLGTRLTALHLHLARDRGCETASLQSTEMAERVYASIGFRDLGRYVEYVPG